MHSFAVVIPAQEKNSYHHLGDLAPFGDTSLLEWKISQCKTFLSDSQIYIISPSSKIEKIAQRENVKFISRSESISYEKMLEIVGKEVLEDNIIWTNPTSPFLSGKAYKSMYKKFIEAKEYDSIISVQKRHEYTYYNDEELNFHSTGFISRRDINPVDIVTNGCYILSKEMLSTRQSLFGKKPFLFSLNALESTEIKDISDLTIANELISIYFRLEIVGNENV